MQERVLRLVIGRFDGFLETNGVDYHGRRHNVDNLHDCIVDTVIGREQIQVASHEDNQKEFLCTNGDACVDAVQV